MYISSPKFLVRVLSLSFVLFFQISLFAAGWSQPKTIGDSISSTPDVAVDDKGDAVAVFVHFDGITQRIQSAIRPFDKHWTTFSDYLSPADLIANSPKVASSPKGNATAVWAAFGNGDVFVQAATYNREKNKWSSPVNLTDPTTLTAEPIVGIDRFGNSIAVWSIYDGESYHVQSAILKHDKKHWKRLDDIILARADNFDLAIDPHGNTVLVWEGLSGFKGIIQAATLKKGAHHWVLTDDITPNNVPSTFPRVGVDGKGNAVLVWSQGFFSSHIGSARLPFGSTVWIHTSDLTPSDRSNFPDIAVDLAGNAVAVWKTFTDQNDTLVQAATLKAGSLNWSAPIILAESLLILDPQVVVDKDGNAVSVWASADGIQGAFLPFGRSWSTPVTITPSTEGAGGQRIAMSPCSFAVVAYTAQVFASIEEVVRAFHSKRLFPPTPPLDFEGHVIIKGGCCTKKEFIHRLTWEASLDDCAAYYILERNGEVIAILFGKGPRFLFDDPNRSRNVKDVYTLTAVKTNGAKSKTKKVILPNHHISYRR